jgi:hypothetical protein
MDPLADNPFHVLDLSPACTAMEVERQAAKLLAMLELGLAAAGTHASPFGPRPRTAEKVREAAAALRDPARRAAFEPWAAASAGAAPDARLAPWPEAFAALTWWR